MRRLSDELRESLGKKVREAWVAYCYETQETPKPSHVAPWEQLIDWDKEVDRRIGEEIVGPYITLCETLLHSTTMGTDGIWHLNDERLIELLKECVEGKL